MDGDSELQDVPLQTPEKEVAPTDALEPKSLSIPVGLVDKSKPVPASKTDGESIGSPAANANGTVPPEVNVNGAVKLPTPEAKISKVVEKIMNHSGEGLKQLTYLELLMADEREAVGHRDIVDIVLNVLVSGQFDLESNFIVKDSSNISHFLKFMSNITEEKLQAEIWSMLCGVLRKSRRNLLAFTEANFIEYILLQIEKQSSLVMDLLMDMMTVLGGFSITVSELQLLYSKLKSVDGEWPMCAPKLLKVLQQMPARHGPDEFFSFPGAKNSAIALPPMSPQKWPYQLGWSFVTWFCLDPHTSGSIDQEKPYIFSIQTKTGAGYSAHFIGSVLTITSNKLLNKGFQACIKFDFEPRKWYHICLAYVYNRWKTSFIRCYVNGELVSTLEMPWFVSSAENFDKCYIGAGTDLTEEHAFSGQMSTIYMFNEALSNPVVTALYNLGPGYKGQFKYSNEATLQISEQEKQVLYDGKLTNAIILMYSPVTCDSHIVLSAAPSGNESLFLHAPHAMLMAGVKAVVTYSIHSTLHSLGGIQMLFPLFGQLDCPREEAYDDDKSICVILMDLLCDLLQNSDTLQQQMVQTRGFLVISHLLEQASPQHLTIHTVQSVIKLMKFFSSIPTAAVLVRHITDHLLFNPSLWIHADPQVQIALYEYIATEYLALLPFAANPLRRVSTVLQLIHAMKHYYWVVNPQPLSGIKPRGTVRARPSRDEIIQLRGIMLAIMDRVITSSGELFEDELQCFLNFISTVNEPENLYDVLHLLILFMINLPASMVPQFDAKNGLRAVYKLLSSDSEAIRVQALKLLGHFLSRSTSKRKAECMDRFNLYTLLGVRLLEKDTHLTMNIYNVLFEILVEKMAHQIVTEPHPEFSGTEVFIQNPAILMVVAKLIKQSNPCEELYDVKRLFLDDLICLCENNEDNRRTVLQMSVWQDWLFSLTAIYPQTEADKEICEVVIKIFRILLFHAIRLEYGGWRVWIDTLSILHSRVSMEDFNYQMSKAYKDYQTRQAIASDQPPEEEGRYNGQDFAGGDVQSMRQQKQPAAIKLPAYRIPEFRWSHLHQRLVSDVVRSIEEEVREWRTDGDQQMMEAVNTSENSVFVNNTINIISNISDVIITAVGGLLPLLSAATTASGEIDVLEPGYGLSIERSVSLLQRMLNLADLMMITSNVSLSELEAEKNMTQGTIMRQCLRMTSTMAVRNCLECRYRAGTLVSTKPLSQRNGGARSINPLKALVDGTKVDSAETTLTLPDPVANIEHLLQESDIMRLRAVLYRDADDHKQAQWLAMSVIYFISVLMVSKYRDILEPSVGPEEPEDAQALSPSAEEAKPPSSSKVKPSPALSKRSSRSISPHRPDDSEDEAPQASVRQEIIADVHIESTNDSREEEQESSEGESSESVTDQDLQDNAVKEQTELSEAEVTEVEESGTKSDEKLEPGTESVQPISDISTVSQSPTEVTKEADDVSQSESAHKTSSTEQSIAEGRLEDNAEPPGVNQPESAQSSVSAEPATDVPAKDPTTGDDEPDERKTPQKPVSSISMTQSSPVPDNYKLQSSQQKMPKPLKLKSDYQSIQANISERLEKALGTCAPLLREIFIDFAPYLTQTLLGTKGQELLRGGLTAIKMGTSAVELVMLLCSQEWQISLQKHAGLAFIELVNEGRLISHSTRDHMVKVANEAEHILNKLRAEDANKHEHFQVGCAESFLKTVEEELTCDRLITSARKRDSSIAKKVVDKVRNIVHSEQGPWSSGSAQERYWKLDSWEDDSRRRRRLVPNPIGSSHPEAALKAALEHGDSEDVIHQARDEFHAQLKLRKQKSELEASAEETSEAEADAELAGPVSLSTECLLIAYGLAVAGTLSVTKYEIFFEWDDEDEQNKKIDEKVLAYIDLHGRWHMQEMRAIFTRTYLLSKRALEIFLINRTSVMFAFPDFDTVKRVVNLLPPVGVGVKYGLRPSRKMSLATPKQLFKQSNMTQRWQRREISNFDYLIFLNTIAGRTYNDLNQYPVFPWVLSNYTSETIDLAEPGNYRDLSKPIGALNPERRRKFVERYSTWENNQIPAFHYGTHYSTAAFTLNWLVRVEPFATIFLNLQDGKFDHANRTFSSMDRAWQNCQVDTSDVKELIPELYFMAEMFLNNNKFRFGTREDKVKVDDVELPPWAKSPEEFSRILREALESEIVSGQLHLWIDLIFGYKQHGPEAIKACNVFYYLTYEGSVDLDSIKDPIMKEAIEAQIRSFGQTPSQILTEPHPFRGSQMGVTPRMFSTVSMTEACMSLKFWSRSPVVHLSANVYPQQPTPSVITIMQNKHFAVNPWNNNPAPPPPKTAQSTDAQQSTPTDQILASLPLNLDPLLNASIEIQQARRNLGDNFDERMKLHSCNFATTIDNKFIFACGFWDNSFRVYSTDTGKVLQIVYGHFDVVNCICRSEVNMMHDCFIVTGSRDCTCMIWQWLGQKQLVYSDYVSSTGNPVPQATLTGHKTAVVSVVISAELGIVASASKEGQCLIHTMNGDLLRALSPDLSCTDPQLVYIHREGYIVCLYNSSNICLYNVNGRFLHHNNSKTTIRCMRMTRDGRFIVTAGDSGVVSIWRSHDLSHLFSYPYCEGIIYDLDLSYDQRYIIVGVSTGCVIVLNVDFTLWHHDYQRSKPISPPSAVKSAEPSLKLDGSLPLSPPQQSLENPVTSTQQPQPEEPQE